MFSYADLLKGDEKISLIGLGYVGLPIAVAFAKKVPVIGFDVSKTKIALYKQGVDPTNEVGDLEIKSSTVQFTDDPADLKQARFHIVAVPTPVSDDKTPDLQPVKSASCLVGQNLQPGSIIVYESTVYPGVTEEICIPILEKESGLVCGKDFKVGYSPERINPGDKVHRLDTIIKIVSGMDEETLDIVARVYELVVKVGVHRAASIKVAEAAKVIENSQRDINIAFMNELSIIFHRLGIDTKEVLKAAGTKWNFLNFYPGLVGGHCIGVDPYYLTYKAEQTGYHSQVILSGRRINDEMGRYVAQCTIKKLLGKYRDLNSCIVNLLGFTFKENCPDTRNTRVIDIVQELGEYGVSPVIADPVADAGETKSLYGIDFVEMDRLHPANCLILAVAHSEFKELDLKKYLQPGGLLIDIKGVFEPEEIQKCGYEYWRL